MHKFLNFLSAHHVLATLLLFLCFQPSLAQSPFHYSKRFRLEQGFDSEVNANIGVRRVTDRVVFSDYKQGIPTRSGGSVAYDWEYLSSPYAKVQVDRLSSTTMGSRVGNKKLKATQKTINFTFAETFLDNMIIEGVDTDDGPFQQVLLAGGDGTTHNELNGIVPFRLLKDTNLKLDYLKLCLTSANLYNHGPSVATATAKISILQDVNGNGLIDENDGPVYGQSFEIVLFSESYESKCKEINDDLFTLKAGRYILLTELQNVLVTALDPINILDLDMVHVEAFSSSCVASGSISVLPTPILSTP